jgi:flagellar hook assembly protein FlgD
MTALSFELQAASLVTLKVYDTAGRLVTTLVDGWREAGTHEMTFDGSKLASGIYLAKMQAGEFTAVQKLVLIK